MLDVNFGKKNLNSLDIFKEWVKVVGNYSTGTIQVLRHQRGGWVGSENGNF